MDRDGSERFVLLPRLFLAAREVISRLDKVGGRAKGPIAPVAKSHVVLVMLLLPVLLPSFIYRKWHKRLHFKSLYKV